MKSLIFDFPQQMKTLFWFFQPMIFSCLTFPALNDFSVWLFQRLMTFPADDDLLDPGSYSDSLVLGCVLLSFAGSLSSTCLCVCLGHALPWKYGLHITNTWIWNQSGICTVPISLTQIPVQKLIIQNTNPLRCNNCLCKVLSNIYSSNTFFHVKYHFCIKPIWTNLAAGL